MALLQKNGRKAITSPLILSRWGRKAGAILEVEMLDIQVVILSGFLAPMEARFTGLCAAPAHPLRGRQTALH